MHGYSEITLQHNLLAFAENSVISSIVLMNLALNRWLFYKHTIQPRKSNVIKYKSLWEFL